MKKREAIRNRRSNKVTLYHPGEKMTPIPAIGTYPSVVEKMWDDGQEVQTTFTLAAITGAFVYYADEQESDDTASIVMLTRDMKLMSDNYFAFNDLFGVVQKNDGLLWMSKAVELWQKDFFVKQRLITPKMKALLEGIDVQKLTKKERIIYLAYLNNGPVTYTKPQSLMAILSNDLDQTKYSDHLSAIMKMLPEE